jgi:dTDP-4-dehydrorhamnose 3,5-epimerase
VTAPVKYSVAGRQTIDGVKVKPLRVIADERGWLMEILRADEPELFSRFGQVYVSATYPGVVKGWHYHRKQVDNFACIAGMIKPVLIDTRAGSPTGGTVNEFFIGVHNPALVQVPSLVYHGWKRISPKPSLVVNVPNEPYQRDEPDEYRLEPHGTLACDWSRNDG